MNKPAIIASAAALLVAASGATVYYVVTHEDVDKPDLDLHTKFPAGFDRQPVQPTALGFDGKSRCFGLLSFLDHDWKHDGIAYTDQPTVKDVLKVNPLEHEAYDYVGDASPPQRIIKEEFEAVTDLGLCTFQYEGYIWQTSTEIKNVEPVELPDDAGTPLRYAKTAVYLGGDGDGQGGSRFFLEGTSPDASSVGLHYMVYPDGSTDRRDRAYIGVANAVLTGNGTFGIPFTVPTQSFAKATLVMIPVHVRDDHAYALDGELTSLTRLETTDAQVIVGATQPVTAPAPPTASAAFGGRVVHGNSLGDVQSRLGSSDALEGVGNAAFLVQQAVEPKAKPGSGHLVQRFEARTAASTVHVDVLEPGTKTSFQASFAWKTERRSAQFVVGLAESRALSPAQVVGATASVSHIGADGARVIEAIGQGPTPQVAIVAAHAGLDAKGQAATLAETLSQPVTTSRQLLDPAQKYMLAAGALAAGWEWFQVANADDVADQVVHTARATRVVAETLFSLTPQGAVFIAAVNLAELLVKNAVPYEWWNQLERGFNTIVLGRVSPENARQAFTEIEPDLELLAEEHDAGWLPVHYDRPKETPGTTPALLVSALVLVALAARRAGGIRPE